MDQKIAIILGTNRPNRIGNQIADWVQRIMVGEGLAVDVLDLQKIGLPFLDEPEIPAHGNYVNEHTKTWSKLIQSYGGLIFLFPQYNWGYPAVMKNAIDYLYSEWAGKPVSIVAYGAHGGYQSVIAMQLVVHGLHMKNLAVNPAILINDDMFGADYRFKNAEQALVSNKTNFQLLATEFKTLLN